MSKTIADLFDEVESGVVTGSAKEDREFEELPDGRYRCEILECALRQQKKSGDPFVSIKARVSDGPKAGRYIFPHQFFSNNATRLSIVKEQLGRLGLAGIKFKDLKDRCSEVEGRSIVIEKTSRPSNNPEKPFVNYFFHEVRDEDGGDAGFDN